MSWTHYTVQINTSVRVHDEAQVHSADQIVGEATRRLSGVVEREVALMQETAPPGVEIEVI